MFALLAGSWPPARDFWTEFSVAIGYAGLAMMGLQFGLTARFRYVTEPWGEDVIYHFHRQISLIAVGARRGAPAHSVHRAARNCSRCSTPSRRRWRARFAALSIYSLIALVVMALWRAKLNIRYETWHLTHIVLALVAVAAGLRTWSDGASTSPTPGSGRCGSALTIFWIGLLLYVRIVKPLFMLRRPYRVAEVRRERGDTGTLVMRPDGHPGLPLQPGPVRLADGVGEPVQDHRTPVLVLVQRRGDGRRASR